MCIGAGILLWFLIDTMISLYFQVFFNVAFNLVILMAVALPLGMTMRHFRVRKGGSGSHKKDRPFTVVAMEKEAQASLMHHERF